MGIDTRTRRAVGLFLLAFGVAMGIAAMADKTWVDQKDLDGRYGTYKIGLREWQIVNSAAVGDCDRFELDELGQAPSCLWNPNLLGSLSSWDAAGEGALYIGVTAIVVLGFAMLFALISLCRLQFSKKPAAILAFIAGLTFLVGALVFDQLRPSFGGDMGYRYPVGLYLAAGLMGELACIVLWSADYVPEKGEVETR